MLIASEVNALVIDDNDHGRKQTEQALKQLGIVNMFGAVDAVSGFDILISNTIDIVFLDWYMPEINGAGFVRLARSRSFNCRNDIPIIVTTAFATLENTTRIRELELTEILIKPFSGKQLSAALSIAYSRIEPKMARDDTLEEEGQYLL